jgi:hypothetical protein
VGACARYAADCLAGNGEPVPAVGGVGSYIDGARTLGSRRRVNLAANGIARRCACASERDTQLQIEVPLDHSPSRVDRAHQFPSGGAPLAHEASDGGAAHGQDGGHHDGASGSDPAAALVRPVACLRCACLLAPGATPSSKGWRRLSRWTCAEAGVMFGA